MAATECVVSPKSPLNLNKVVGCGLWTVTGVHVVKQAMCAVLHFFDNLCLPVDSAVGFSKSLTDIKYNPPIVRNLPPREHDRLISRRLTLQ